MKLSFFTFLLVMFATATAAAQTPYSAKKMSRSQLIKMATFDRAPVKLEYPLISTRQAPDTRGRMNFEQTYDIPFTEFMETMEAAFKGKKPMSALDPARFPYAKTPQLIVYGFGQTGDGTRQITLGHKDVPFRVLLHIVPDEQNRAKVVIRNTVFSSIYSGVMPARTPFRPVGSDPVSFRWN